MSAALNDIARARDALLTINPDLPHHEWVKFGMAAKSAGLDFEDFDEWSAMGEKYAAATAKSAWRSFRPDGGIGAGTLFRAARENGWRDDVKREAPSKAEIEAAEKRRAERVAAERAAEAAEEAQAAERALAIWNAAAPATEHPYLTRKGIQPHGTRFAPVWVKEFVDHDTGEVREIRHRDALLVPIWSAPGKLSSLQAIFASKCIGPKGRDRRDKDMMAGGRKRGCYFLFGKIGRDTAEVVVCEGFATGASIHEATKLPVLVAFDTSNLAAVAVSLRSKLPEAKIVLAADNDETTSGNPGLTAARAAAGKMLGVVAVPAIAGDFNDLHQAEGSEAVRGAIRGVISVALDGVAVPAAAPATPARNQIAPLAMADAMVEIAPTLSFTDVRDGTAETRALTELGNALRLLDAYGDRLRHVPERKVWLVWDDGRWRVADAGVVRALASSLSGTIYKEGLKFLADGDHFAKWARKSQERRTIDATVSLLGDMPTVRIDARQLDADTMLCGLDGGRKVLDLRTGVIRATTQGDLITRSLGVAELGDSTKAVRWTRFLQEVFQGDGELIGWMKRFLGYSLTGSVDEQVFIFAFGGGANGKSVLTESIARLMGDYSASVQPATLCDDRRNASGATADLARLDGVRFAVAPEAEENSRFNEPLLKGLVSGDRMQVRELYCAPRDMSPILKLALTGNHKPTITGTDRGIWRRVRLVPFQASFEGRADPQLLAKLQTEFPHILAWLVEGCMQWQQQGLQDTPAVVAAATEDYRQESDTLGHWLSERCTKGTHADELANELYRDFREWCDANGFKRPWTSQVFGKKLTEYRAGGWSIGERRTLSARYRTGIALRRGPVI